MLHQASRNLARTIWMCTLEREGEDGKEDILDKLYVCCQRSGVVITDPVRSAMNLILAFAVALKHKLRFEPDVAYDDLVGLVSHLDTFAKDAHDRQRLDPAKKSFWKSAGETLSLSIAESDPRKHVKRSKKPLGHLPLEILNHLSAYINQWIETDALKFNVHQTQAGMFNLGITSPLAIGDPLLTQCSQLPDHTQRSRHGCGASARHAHASGICNLHRPNHLDLCLGASVPAFRHALLGDYPWLDWYCPLPNGVPNKL